MCKKKCNPLEMNDRDFWAQLYRLTAGKVFDDAHHFMEQENFTMCSGHLQMKDYGSRRCHEVIEKYGEEIVKKFDISFKYKETESS